MSVQIFIRRTPKGLPRVVLGEKFVLAYGGTDIVMHATEIDTQWHHNGIEVRFQARAVRDKWHS